MTDVRVGVLGAGRWGRNLVSNLDTLGALTAVSDPSPAIRSELTAAYGHRVRITEDHEAILGDAAIDAVVIATPATTHASLAIEAVRAGKHVFVEKPFTLTVDDAELVVKEAEAAGRTLMVGHLLLYQPAIVWMREFLRSGRLGWVASLYQDRLSLGTVRTVENSLWSLGVHDVAAILYLEGQEPVRTATWGEAIIQPGVQDDMHLHMQFANGAEAHIHNSWLWPERRRRLTVVGTEAMAVYDELTQTVQLHRRRVNANLTVQDDGSDVVFRGDPEPLRHELEHFLSCVRNGTEPRSNGASAVAVIRVLSQADTQMKELAAPV
ncbi:MAG TPA: Gfo/Idh/MocA family oxidoreductase [Actinomycetota bacterium]|nr:Gfo/Idh/MocA family oxidoreductase [Actinomycetota bacterium]